MFRRRSDIFVRQAGKQQTKFGLGPELTIRQVINKQLLYNWICFWFVGICCPTRRQDFRSVQEIGGDRSRHMLITQRISLEKTMKANGKQEKKLQSIYTDLGLSRGLCWSLKVGIQHRSKTSSLFSLSTGSDNFSWSFEKNLRSSNRYIIVFLPFISLLSSQVVKILV